jgi:hypothetical protein
MDDAMAARLRTLAEEFVAFVDAMRGGQYADSDEWRQLRSARTVVRDELPRLTGMTRRDDMHGYCRELLAKRASRSHRAGQ